MQKSEKGHNHVTKVATQLALLWCYFKYGRSIWQLQPVRVAIRNNLSSYGQYKHYDITNDEKPTQEVACILINPKLHNFDLKECVGTAIHEYVHHLQQIDVYDSYFNKGFGYDDHPLESEAAHVSKRDVEECYEWVSSRMKS
jgi:hypothetical protein